MQRLAYKLIIGAMSAAASCATSAAAFGAYAQSEGATGTAFVRPAQALAASLRRLDAGFVAGDAIGWARSGVGCAEATERDWSDLIAQRLERDLHAELGTQLAQGHADAQAAAIEVTPFVNDLRVDLCSQGRAGWKGTVYVQVSWTVRAARTGRVIYQASTSGAASQTDLTQGSTKDGVRRALALAVRDLFHDARFAAALTPYPGGSVVAKAR